VHRRHYQPHRIDPRTPARKNLGDGSTQQKKCLGASVYAVERLLIAMCRRLTKPSKKATSPAPANSHRANARSGIFAGRQKGGKRQQKATAKQDCSDTDFSTSEARKEPGKN
jgi:hypothetical protein